MFITIFIGVFFSTGIFFLIYSLYKMDVERIMVEEKVDLQREYLAGIQREQNEIDKMQSDMGDMVVKVKEYLDKDEKQYALDSLQKKYDVYQKNAWIEMSNNPLIDAVLHNGLRKCQKDNIILSANVIVPDDIMISERELVLVFQNILSNAIEACERSGKTTKYIVINTHIQENYVYYKMENTPAEVAEHFTLTWKKDKKRHGLGLSIVRDIVESNEGLFSITQEEQVVTLITLRRVK